MLHNQQAIFPETVRTNVADYSATPGYHPFSPGVLLNSLYSTGMSLTDSSHRLPNLSYQSRSTFDAIKYSGLQLAQTVQPEFLQRLYDFKLRKGGACTDGGLRYTPITLVAEPGCMDAVGNAQARFGSS